MINLEKMAKEAASWPYAVRISEDETTDGHPIYIATHPELIGCIAQGTTVEEATENLKEVTFEYIVSLLEDRVPIPLPSVKLTKTTQAQLSISNTFLGTISEVIEPCTRQEISEVELVS
jgi:predicted RNase H-like HicB family nuclease